MPWKKGLQWPHCEPATAKTGLLTEVLTNAGGQRDSCHLAPSAYVSRLPSPPARPCRIRFRECPGAPGIKQLESPEGDVCGPTRISARLPKRFFPSSSIWSPGYRKADRSQKRLFHLWKHAPRTSDQIPRCGHGARAFLSFRALLRSLFPPRPDLSAAMTRRPTFSEPIFACAFDCSAVISYCVTQDLVTMAASTFETVV
ncbi:hypothetical protein CALCODRAFT_211039 [Calocera cornea HHB12733]|uniref:Uncharacterized protein n=1 Tax=Calocera cornea HHB12733 TaxID=1353952 RepID=A0A165HEZ7_9BASI|nr:hypothetical protein CALCODRAFT_211039 [Calocera cornea HHB12733]